MKENLQYLFKRNKREYKVWSYLWIFSEKNEIIFSYQNLSYLFDIPVSSLHRIVNKNISLWQSQGIDISIEKCPFKTHKISFKKPKLQVKINNLEEELTDFMKSYYTEIEYDYPDFDKHQRYIKTIINKLKKAMRQKGTMVDDFTICETFKLFVKNIDDWWVQSGNISLPMISKHFTKMLNQVKNNNNGKKRDSYSSAQRVAEEIDFDKLARK
jgi:hypothetical protein